MLLSKNSNSIIVTLLLLLYPILYTYGWGFFSFGFIPTILLMISYWIFNRHLYLQYPKVLFLYISYFLIARVLCATSLSTLIAPSTTSMMVVLGFFLFCLRNTDIKLFLRCYRIIAFTCIIFFFFQELMYYTIGYRFSGILTVFPLTLGGVDGIDASVWEMARMSADRSSSFFSEPAHFVQFLLPLLILEFLFVSKKKAYLRGSVIAITLLALQSGNALIGLAVFSVFFLCFLYSKFNHAIFLGSLLLILALGIFATSAMLNTEQGEKLLERQEQLNSDQIGSSGFLRIWRGYFVYSSLSLKEQILGVNNKEVLKKRIKKSSVNWSFKDENDLYFNTVQSFLLYTGVVGLFLFLLFIIWIWKENNLAGRCILITFCALCCIASLFFTHTMLLYLILSILMKRENVKCEMIRIKI